MKSFLSHDYGRIIVIHLGKGELLQESIAEELKRQGIKNAVLLSCIGSLRKLSMHIITTTKDMATNEFLTLEEPIEIGTMQGLVLNGEPHFHIVCSAPGNRNFAGHLENGCEIQYLAEISLLEVKDMALTRKLDAFGIGYIDAL
jgi:predicted DNA-binding protein with PD1-like motif